RKTKVLEKGHVQWLALFPISGLLKCRNWHRPYFVRSHPDCECVRESGRSMFKGWTRKQFRGKHATYKTLSVQ
ncbi:hypothetical protein COCVIDRAFT_87687, partial [Bipolaris victoriae FI3]